MREGQYVAVKVHQLNRDWTHERKEQYLRHTHREYDIQKRADHPRIVKLHHCFKICNSSFATVLEYTPYGDLDSHLKGIGAMTEAAARPIMAQILGGLQYLHSIRIIHYDLKPANVLFFSRAQVKLTDFGLSKSITGPHARDGEDTGIELTSQGAGTIWYLPPECFEVRKPQITTKVDMFSAGVCFFQMVCGRRPFGHGASQKQVMMEGIMTRVREVEFPKGLRCSAAGRDVIRDCLRRSAADRPSASEILEGTYFSGSGGGYGSGTSGNPNRKRQAEAEGGDAKGTLEDVQPQVLVLDGEGEARAAVVPTTKRRRVIPTQVHSSTLT